MATNASEGLPKGAEDARQAVARGALQERPLANLLHQLFRKRVTGCLTVTDETGDESCVYLRDGVPVHVLRPNHVDRLDQVLVEAGLIPFQVVTELAAGLPPGRRLGEVLIERGLLTSTALADALKLQMRRKLLRLFFPRQGQFAIYLEPHTYGAGDEFREMRVDPRCLIYPGLRAAYDEERLRAELAPVRGRSFRLLPTLPTSMLEVMGFPPGEATLKALGDRFLRLEELPIPGTKVVEGLTAVLALLYTDLLETSPGAATAPAAARPQPAAQNLGGARVAVVPVGTTGSFPSPAIPGLTGSFPAATPGVGRTGSFPAPGDPSARPAVSRTASMPAVELSPMPPLTMPAASPMPPLTMPSPMPPITTPAPTVSRTASMPAANVPSSPMPPITMPAPTVSRTASMPAASVPPSPMPPIASPAPTIAARPVAVDPALVTRIDELYAKLGTVSHFELLGLAETATPDEIAAAYLRNMRQLHPDRLAGSGLLMLVEKASRIVAHMNDAHSVLTDAKRRADYLATRGAPPPVDAGRTVVAAEESFQKGEVLLRKGDHARAAEAFAAAMRASALEPAYKAYWAWARFEAPGAPKDRLVRETIAILEESMRERPRFPQALYWLGLCHKYLGDMASAETAFRNAVTQDSAQLEAERELRLIEMRRSRASATVAALPDKPGTASAARQKEGLFNRFLKKG